MAVFSLRKWILIALQTVQDLKRTLGVQGIGKKFQTAFDAQVAKDKKDNADRARDGAKYTANDFFHGGLTSAGNVSSAVFQKLAALEDRKYGIKEEGRKIRYRREDR